MPVITHIQTNFTGGVLSPLTAGYVDSDRWNVAAKEILNGIPLITGGVLRRPGMRRIAVAGDPAHLTIPIPYVFNEDQAYILEFGHEIIRVYHDDALVMSGGVPYEITSPYTASHLIDLEWHRQGDTLYLLHQTVPPHRLQRFGHALWRLEPVDFNPMPYAEIGHRLNTAITLSAATVGTGRTLTAASSAFLLSDVGRDIIAGPGRAVITGYTSSTVVTATIEAAFEGTSLAAMAARILGSPQGALEISVAPADASIGIECTLDSASYNPDGEKVVTHLTGELDGLGGTTVTATCTAHGYSTSDEVNISGYDIIGVPSPPVNGTFTITVVDANNFTYTLDGLYEFDEPDNGTCRRVSGTGAALDLFRPEDVGSYVQINSGLVRITQFDSAKKVTGTLSRMHTSDIAARPNAWILNQPAWSDADGYPRTGTSHQQRLILAGSTSFPGTIWGSATGMPHDFELWTNDDDAFSFALSTYDPIRHVSSQRALLAFTNSSEFALQGGTEKPITPTNVQVSEHTSFGANGVKPLRVGGEILFCQRGGTRVRAVAYRFETDSFVAPDLSWIAAHLIESGVVSAAYQQEPHSTLWCATTEGKLVSLTLDRDSKTVAWAEHETDGEVESVACIPRGASDRLWMVVRRVTGHAETRYIESLDEDLMTDCAITASGAESLVWDCAHLENKVVDVIGDGMYHGRYRVDDGQVTLDHPASSVEIGLPYTTRVVTLTPHVEGAGMTPHGNAMSSAEVVLRFHETAGATLNGREIPFRKIGDEIMDNPLALFTGDVRLEKLGWDAQDELSIEQRVPLPWHLLAVIRKYQWNG